MHFPFITIENLRKKLKTKAQTQLTAYLSVNFLLGLQPSKGTKVVELNLLDFTFVLLKERFSGLLKRELIDWPKKLTENATIDWSNEVIPGCGDADNSTAENIISTSDQDLGQALSVFSI